MRLQVFFFVCFAALCWAYHNQDIVDSVNSDPTSTWKAGVNEIFKDKSLESIKRLLGAKTGQPKKGKRMLDDEVSVALPTEFESAKQWPGCQSLTQIRNQAECGSCWAFGAVEAFTDRYCIASGQKQNPIFSTEYMISCDYSDNGCEGGMPYNAWDFIYYHGLPTNSCQPYTIPTCPPSQQPCLNFKPTPPCKHTCYGNSSESINNRYYVSDVYYVGGYFSSSEKIQQEIMKNGPVEAAFTVYEDFVHYKSGVYQHKTGSALGGHAIKIVGWGVENGTPYWNIANSWTTYWGDNGYFKILRGSDECGIESDVVAGTPKVKN